MAKNYILLFASLFIAVSCTSNGKENSNLATDQNSSAGVQIEERWELPDILSEVSGISYLDNDRFACVQDEDGKIFIYNTSTSEIEKEIDFAGAGDYEGLTLVGENAYVVRSDGKIYEIGQWNSENSTINEYDTPLTADHNVEGLCYDQPNNRLLLALKDGMPDEMDLKGIYGFDLSTKKLDEDPVIKIDLNDPRFATGKSKKKKKFRPSEIGIHPVSGDIYVTEGSKSRLLIMESTGKIKTLLTLNKEEFAQAEGISFSPEGDLFISNEGKKGKANILKINIDQ